MTDGAALLRCWRAGGRPPSDDESLEVAADGSWTARRTVGGRRVGRFVGRLAEGDLAALVADAARAAETGDAEVPTPRDGATETLEVAGGTITLGSNERAPSGWHPLVERVRALLRDALDGDPVAALGLEADVARARLVQAGGGVVEVDPASVSVRVARVGPDGTPFGRWQAGSGAEAGWTRVGPGWTLDLPYGHGLAPVDGDVLQVWVFVRVRDGGTRASRLYVPVPAGGTPRGASTAR